MAGSNDFTGQNIQDTYQRVLQISSSSQLADGTGSLIPFLNVSSSYALTASIEITKEISSSNADSASLVMLSTQPNITSLGTLTELNVNGNITASNNISASGTIISSNLSGTNTGDQDLSNLVTNDQTASFAVTGSDVIFGNITASGDISASGNGYFSTQFYIDNVRTIYRTSTITTFGSSDRIFQASGTNIKLPSPVTASIISASGNIHSSNLIIKDSSKIGTANGINNQDTYIQLVDNDNQIIISSDGDETVQIQSGVVGIGGAPGATNPLTVYGNISSSGEIIGRIDGGSF